MLDAAQAQGWNARILNGALEGDVADAAAEIIAAAKSIENTTTPTALIFGGETTVQLRGDGLGGRNQELALRVARDGASELTGKWLFLSGGTDGRDGPTEAAGGIVDGTSWDKIRTAGADPQALLANNDSNKALALCDALLMTGGTGTNVADVQVLLRLPA
jgi:hydroxypyruvate reductase